MKMYEAILKKKKDNSLNEYKENALLTDEIVEKIMDDHCLTLKEIHKNCYLQYNKKIVEFDALIEAETPTGRKRWISVELKESDISKVINQAVVRRDFAHFSYIILNSRVKWVVQYLFYVYPELVNQEMIGFFTNNIFVLPSKSKKPRIEINMDGEKYDKNK